MTGHPRPRTELHPERRAPSDAGRPGTRRRLARALGALAVAAVAVAGSACDSPPLSYVEATITGGVLSVRGTDGPDTIVLRVQDDDAGMLEVDVHDDGFRDFAFRLADVRAITVEGFAGDDLLVTDTANGRFSPADATTLLGGEGDDTLLGGHGDEVLDGGPGRDTLDRRPGPARVG